ncbi:MAG: L-rhamnose mutarotase [Bacteroidota bacterium]|jgi:L-rhamnose mutarotase|nr:L-rhamnose mutarotase [Chitinophagaceae bacterium]MCE2758892.1 L-rhamnose mutarotase [Chitinophagaceae bacterium]
MKTYCLALDLKNDAALIAAYEKHHEQVWSEIEASIKESGIESMKIYRTGNRLFMIIHANNHFSFEKKNEMDKHNPIVEKWEALMDQYQQRLPWAAPGVKWVLMDEIFSLD